MRLIVKKIAAGYNRSSLISTYSFHVIISGGIFYGLLLLNYLLFPQFLTQQNFLLYIGIGKLAIFLSTPFKQLATGLEKFSTLFLMSVVSNIFRGIALFVLLWLHKMSLFNVLAVFVIGDLSELVLCYIVGRPLLHSSYAIRWNKRRQILLLKESLPQTGVVFFTAIMSRFDWILIGLLISSSRLADYSFAYKIFEVSTLPLLIVAPIMIPLFTRLQKLSENMYDISFLLEWQIILASFIALMLNICWIPAIDFISDGKYGRVNADTVFLLSLSMPLMYLTNYLWTIHFAKGNLKFIFNIMAISFAVNIAGCCILIPLYKNEGAAVAYFVTVLIQLILYLRKKSMIMHPNSIFILVFWPITALFCGLVTSSSANRPGFSILLAVAIYLAVVFISNKIRAKDWKILQSLYQ